MTAEEPAPERDGTAADRAALALLAVCATAFVVALTLTPVFNGDFWIQLSVGEIIRETGRIPDTVLFTFTEARDNPFTAYEWLPSLAWSHVYLRFGYTGAVVLKCILSLGIFAGLVALCRQVSGSWVLSIGLGAVGMLGINYRTLLRPELLALLFAVVNLNLLEAHRRTGRPIWLVGLLPTSLLWANSHGSVLLNLALPAFYALGGLLDATWTAVRTRGVLDLETEARRVGWLALATLGMIAASLVNPYGFGLLAHVFQLSSSDFIRAGIVEWQPLLSERFYGLPFFVVATTLSATVLASLVIGWRRVRPSLLVLLLPFWVLMFDAMRHGTWFAIVATWALAQTLEPPRASGPARLLTALGLTALMIGGTLTVARHGNVRGMQPGFAVRTPLAPEAIAYLGSREPRGNVFNSYEYGDQLVYHFFPDVRVAMDSRLDAYGERRYAEHQRLSGRRPELRAPASELMRFLDHYAIDWIVLHAYDFLRWAEGGRLDGLAERGFAVVYRDDATVILERGAAEPAG